MSLLDEESLEASSVVANSRMNRERDVQGANGYCRELRFDIPTFLTSRLESSASAAWLDICCGTGRALVQTAEILREDRHRLRMEGVDLVDFFVDPPRWAPIKLQTSPIRRFAPSSCYDLITCVHGLHYVGDKVAVIASACRWLKANGVFLASIDLQNLRSETGRSSGPGIVKALRANGVAYHSRTRTIRAVARRFISIPFEFLGADDKAGPNSTGQPAVNSFYRKIAEQ